MSNAHPPPLALPLPGTLRLLLPPHRSTFRVYYQYNGTISGVVFQGPCVFTHSIMMGNRVVFLVVGGWWRGWRCTCQAEAAQEQGLS